MWTHFWDMNSGGGKKHGVQHIFIEADADEAKVIFFNRFGTNPERVTCTCCGGDYSITSGELKQITGYHRGCLQVENPKGTYRYAEQQDPRTISYKKYQTIEEFRRDPDTIFVDAASIKDSERKGEVPEQGYVWKD